MSIASLIKFLSAIRGAIFVVLFVLTPIVALFVWQEREESSNFRAHIGDGNRAPAADKSATTAESGVTITVSMDKVLFANTDKKEKLPLIITIMNTNNKGVLWITYPPCEGMFFYGLTGDGRKKAVYPWNPDVPPERLNMVGSFGIAPGKSVSLKIKVPSQYLYIHGRRILASIGEMQREGSADRFEVFSDPFELPDLK